MPWYRSPIKLFGSGCLVGASLPLVAFFILIIGSDPPFHRSIRTKALSKPNPTSFVFKASVDQIHAVLRNGAVNCCGVLEFKDAAPLSSSILDLPGNENDVYIHNFHSPIGPSLIYYSTEGPLPYLCEFQLHMISLATDETQIVVIPQHPEVIDGRSWWGVHGTPANIYISVAPTSIEEYRILLQLGAALGEAHMPPIVTPTTP